jgi:hypothetical protein
VKTVGPDRRVPHDGARALFGPIPPEDLVRNDVTFVAIMVAFFALAALFVIACDKIIGSDEEALAAGAEEQLAPEPEKAAA